MYFIFMSPFQDGVILVAGIPPPLDAGTSSMQQVLSFSLPLPSPPAPPKPERKDLDGTIAAFPMKLKQSLTWWSVH